MSSTTIEVAKYIHDLLYEYSSVIVPNLGAFSTRNKMAAINEDDQTISPPVKTVVFNERLKVNDGILVGHIAKIESIPPSLVEEALKKFAAQTKATLQAGEAVSLGSLGTLQDEGDKGIQFYPTQDLNLSLNSFGFKTLNLPVITATTPPNNNDNIGAAGVGGTSELDLSAFEEEKNLPEEEEIPDTPSEKRTVSSVLAENAQNLPPVIPPEKRRRSGGGWFWLLPLLILGLCVMLIMQLQKEDNKGMVSNETETTESEKSSGLWSIPPFSWFAGDDNKEGELADNDNTNHSRNTNSSTDKPNKGHKEKNSGDTQKNDKEALETANKDDKTDQDSNTNNKENTANSEEADKPSSDGTGNNNETTANTNTNENAGTAGSENSNTDTKTSTTDNTTTNTNNSGNTVLTNTAALNGINIAKARTGEYASSNAPKGYYIIVGAFKSQANANKAINKLKTKGYEAHALKTTSGYYRVGIYGSTNGNTAKEQYNKARANENKKAWLLNFN